MKKNRLFVLGIITMFVAILSLTLVSGTMARYTSTVTGSDTVTVAKWAWTLQDDSNVDLAGGTYTFGLFDTIVDTVDGNDDAHVKDDRIAPGTKGQFTIHFNNKSEVTAKVFVSFTSNEAVLPIVYSLDGTNWVGTIAELNDDAEVNGVEVAMETGTYEQVIYWMWAFDETSDGWDSQKDTNLGLTPVNHSVTMTVRFEQVD